MGGHVADAANVTAHPWSNNTLEFQVMDQNFTRAQEIFRSSVVAVGIFLNVLVFSVVSLSRQLRYPRHLFWAAISIFECLFLVEYALELAVVLDHDRKACRVLLLIYPVDYSLLLACLLLAAIDRYVSIVRYEWYKAHVTNRGVVLLIAVVSIVSFVIITSPFWTGYQSIDNCTVNLTHVNRVFVWDLLLGVVCVVLHLKIFVRTRALIRQYVPSSRQTPITVRFVRSSIGPSNASSAELKVNQNNYPTSTERVFITIPENLTADKRRSSHQQDSLLPQPHRHQPASSAERFKSKRSKIHRLEVQAAFIMSANILPFSLCTFPVSCYAIALYWCLRLEGDCNTILLTWTYMWDLFMLHSIYNPVMFMSTSPEFWKALLRITRKWTKLFHVRFHDEN